MPPKEPKPRSKAKTKAGDGRTAPAVVAFLQGLEHPLKGELDRLRQLILGLDPAIHEEIKWNAPSFRTEDHFATFHLRAKDRLSLILHTGAKVKGAATTGVQVADPDRILDWLAKDRAVVTIRSAEELEAKRGALEALLRNWIRALPSRGES
ncbi:DUF1801 domain-containing protein [Vulgatibacter incomptus]|uniref:YdhG-like domain-containing protein n=1 Tax=Vulgatibacter incomptus TaxID=1391653 RepID=A0A0K1PGA6_9BACT|nr:DUF1801 domain-containing protein [Vulgatibacter incomptus]AKU92550.1 hypothetical protein AKJ08_2937 [Vulgatibacter incomptus]